jgi:hypothetical protein
VAKKSKKKTEAVKVTPVNPYIHPIIFKDIQIKKFIGTILTLHKSSTIILKASIAVSTDDASLYTGEITVLRKKVTNKKRRG